ncbi:MAG: XRE family transcriptional regulator [Tannerellaceae bacterium]|jgi:transcriptional regulator with XRE-family HTH domain|nr:XRE family transcriptional regulator [Tannerellaceae bacterium]
MNEQIKQIAERLAGLRDALDITPQEMSRVANLSVEEYLRLESGDTDISVSILHRISQAYNVELTTLMFGDEPKMNTYFVTRKGKGVAVERTKAYKYQSLAAGFAGRKADPFLVTVHPTPDNAPVYLNSHTGQEYNLILEGCMLLRINGKDVTLNEGDSIYFNSELPHGMKALNGEKVRFLAIII